MSVGCGMRASTVCVLCVCVCVCCVCCVCMVLCVMACSEISSLLVLFFVKVLRTENWQNFCACTTI